jgi:uncharacterized surface anchored protein
MFLDMLFALTCQDFRRVDQEACRKAIEAGSKQSGMYQTITQIQDHATKTVEKVAVNAVGEEALAYPVVVAKVYRDQAVSYGFTPKHILGIDRIETTVNFNGSGSMNLKWSF